MTLQRARIADVYGGPGVERTAPGGPLPPVAVRFAQMAARACEPVLILGETGTGKSYLARLIHDLSGRAGRPFVRVNCGAIPDTLFEREMFGHVRGAFTDARDSREGLFESSNGGTIFLDEIGELPLTLQSKLLSVLDDGRVRRLGASRDTPVDVRVIAATNGDIGEMVRRKQFRIDLFHRIAVLTCEVPPVRERRSDIPRLMAHLLDRIACPAKPPGVTPEAMDALCRFAWPGNVRQLDNVLRRAVVFCESGVIGPEHLPPEVLDTGAGYPHGTRNGTRYVAPAAAEDERRMMLDALRAEGGNRTRAARRLGMSRAALWMKMQLHRIEAE